MSQVLPIGGQHAQVKAGIVAMRTEQEIRFWSPLCALDRCAWEFEQQWWWGRLGRPTFLEAHRQPRRHANWCSNQNVLHPLGAVTGVEECGCNPIGEHL